MRALPQMAMVLLLGIYAHTAAAAADGNVENGKELYAKRCGACHAVGTNARNKLGPELNGIVGRKAGAAPGFNYSAANHKAGEDGWVWDEAKLDSYIENPREAMPGNKMSFAGLREEQDRKDIIAYLKTFSGK